ncbi:GNAT family N-acetyltransferase [Actinomycetes bacterium KLBMP 9797]
MLESDDIAGTAATARLSLRAPTMADLPQLFELYADPQVWGPDPLSRHDNPDQTARMIDTWCAAWHRDGLGMWIATSAEEDTYGAFVGIGGCFIRYGIAWNLGYRLSPRFWGRGYAQEISAAAMSAARAGRPELPITAYVLEGNGRSQATVERTGMTLVWRGPDAGNPDATAVRLLYADRRLPDEVVHALTER